MISRLEKRVKALKLDEHDISTRILKGQYGEVCILFIKQLTDRIMLSNLIIQPLMKSLTDNPSALNHEAAMNTIIFTDECHVETREEKIIEILLDGMTLILFSEETAYLVVDIKYAEKKAIQSPELTNTLRGPRDSFIENLDSNLSLIRYRIKDPELTIEHFKIGRRTKTRVAMVYVRDIAAFKVVAEVRSRLAQIDTDGIIESGELQLCLLNNKYNLFPQMGLIEKSDMACGAILEGKVIIIVEGSGIVLVAPKVFSEFLWSSDDNYDNPYMGFFTKLLRILSLIFSITLSSLFITVTAFNHDLLPEEYIYTLAASRVDVPFNALTGVLILEVIVEIIREAMLRVPKHIGTAIGIVGATIIGQAAVTSGTFSPLLLILVSLSFLSSFVIPDYTLMNSFRILKFFLILMTGTMGIFGFCFGLCFIMTNIISTNSFGVPYFAPFAPFNRYDFGRSFFYSKTLAKKRPNFLNPKDKKRTK